MHALEGEVGEPGLRFPTVSVGFEDILSTLDKQVGGVFAKYLRTWKM